MKKLGWLVLIVLAGSPLVFAQPKSTNTGNGDRSAKGAASGIGSTSITLSDSAQQLTGRWRFEPGDSPVVDGEPQWAQPGFNDSKWASINLTPKAGAVDPAYGTLGFVPGWTQQGFPKLEGYAWYRLRVKVKNPGQPLWLKMPNDFDDAYQIYANGRYVGEYGHFTPDGVSVYAARAASFPLPDPGPDGTIDLALRFYMTGGTFYYAPNAGGMHEAPTIGLASAVHMLQTVNDDANLRFYVSSIQESLLFLVLIPLVAWAWVKNRNKREYFWLLLALSVAMLTDVMLMMGNLTSVMPLTGNTLILDVILHPLMLPLWIMFWWHWFGVDNHRWIVWVTWALTAVEMGVLLCLRGPISGIDLVSRSDMLHLNNVLSGLLAAVGMLLIITLWEGFRRNKAEAWWATFPILLLEFSNFSALLLSRFSIPQEILIFNVGVTFGSIARILMVLVIGILAARRFLQMRVGEEVARRAIHQDLEQAQLLQQRVLVPELLQSEYYSVQSAYQPAQTVGGDFFQTLTKPDGSLLVVIGDVSGKGVSAAMLVAVLVGAIKTKADESFDPASMLMTLNARLAGRSGGHFATCLAAEMKPNGTMRIANAGHLPPYLNGREFELEGSLPLGVVRDFKPSVQTIWLNERDRLTFMTDGVVEATNAERQLFGFERALEVSRLSPEAIVEEAQNFGQQDDITVLTVQFVAA
jgi:Stage II sporulation protein E (SpoIIE)